MVLLDDVVEVLTLTHTTTAPQSALLLQLRDRGRIGGILIHVDDAGLNIRWICENLTKEPLGGSSITLGGEQEINALPRRIHRPIQVPILAFNLNIGFVDPVGSVGRLEVWTTAPIEFRPEDLDPAPDAGGGI
jgi:hypothetical protein